MHFSLPTPGEQHMLDALAELVLSEDPSADDDAYAVCARRAPPSSVLNVVDGSGVRTFHQ